LIELTPATMAIWGAFLILQNASFTLVSRARNSGSLLYHALAAVGSNGIWFASQLFLFSAMVDVLQSGNTATAIPLGVFYTVCTIIGSVGMHWLAMTKIETGTRKVGASA